MKSEHREIAKSGFSVIVIAVVIIMLVMIYFTARGWLASNSSVKASGMSLSAADYNISTTFETIKDGSDELYPLADGVFDVSSLKLGQTFKIKVTAVNSDSHDIRVSLSIPSPNADNGTGEQPYVVNGQNYYLSTQLKITDFSEMQNVTINNEEGKGKYISSTGNNSDYNSGLPIFAGLDYDLTFNNLAVAGFTVPANTTGSFVISVTYVKSEVNQNGFKNFGKNGHGTCKRRLECTYSY